MSNENIGLIIFICIVLYFLIFLGIIYAIKEERKKSKIRKLQLKVLEKELKKKETKEKQNKNEKNN